MVNKKKEKKVENAFKTWLKHRNFSMKRASEDLAVPYSMLYHWVQGNRTPSLFWAIQIDHYTRGAVSCKTWEKVLLQKKRKA